eukprot:COSAG01_NODE_35336_length_533_cov_1.241935_1_plen_135_part_10
MQYNLSQKAQRHSRQPDDCQTLKDWARRIAVAFRADCDASMLVYGGVLSSAAQVDGFPVSSMSQLYLVHDELLEVRGEASSSSSSRRPTAKSSPKSSPAAAKPAAAGTVAAPQKQGRKGAAPAQPVALIWRFCLV